MAEYDGVYVFRPADGEGMPCHFDDGDGKMYQNAYCQQDFDAQHDAEGAVEWVVQYRQVAVVHHHDAADEQGNDDRRHYTDGTIGHGTFRLRGAIRAKRGRCVKRRGPAFRKIRRRQRQSRNKRG